MRRLVADLVEDLVPGPVLRVVPRAWVLIHIGRGAGKASGEDVVPAVAVEVIHPGKEVIGVSFAVLGLGCVDLVLLLELRSREPVGAIHDVDVAVLIQVAGPDAFGVVLACESLTIEGVDEVLFGLGVPERFSADAGSERCQENSKHVARLLVSHVGTPGVDRVTVAQHNAITGPWSASGTAPPESPDKRIHGRWLFCQQSAITRWARGFVRQGRSMLRHRINSLCLCCHGGRYRLATKHPVIIRAHSLPLSA